MKTYAYSLITFGSGQIRIGRQGENIATRIDVDVTPWKTEYPTGTISLFVVPPVGNGYLAAIEEDGNTIRWTIRDTDTAYDGHGKAELILTDASGAVMKSVTAYTICAKSPSAAEPADPPEAIRPWVEQILEAIKSGDVSAEAIAAAVEAYIQEHGVQVEEADPTVPSWAKQPNKPTYTASEVGALPSSYTPPVTSVNGKTGYVALNAQDVGARPDTWTPSASDVGADAAGTASAQVGAHNVSGEAHADLRVLIEGLTSRLNALADSDDDTLDQLSEIVAYIKSNKALIDAVTTGKVSTSDIVDNLTTNASGKVLSAAQGVALKAMIDGIVIPTALPNPQPITINGQRYDGSEAVTVTVSSEGGGTPVEIDDTLTQSGKAADAKAVGDQLSALNEAKANNDELAKVAKSGSYNDLSDKPTIPPVPTTLPNPNKLTFTGAVTAEYDGSAPVSVEIPEGSSGSYTLPIASPTTLGGVKPVTATDDMTQDVGVTAEGKLKAPAVAAPSDAQIKTAVDAFLTDNPPSGLGWTELEVIADGGENWIGFSASELGVTDYSQIAYLFLSGTKMLYQADESTGEIAGIDIRIRHDTSPAWNIFAQLPGGVQDVNSSTATSRPTGFKMFVVFPYGAAWVDSDDPKHIGLFMSQYSIDAYNAKTEIRNVNGHSFQRVMEGIYLRPRNGAKWGAGTSVSIRLLKR